MFSGIVEEIGAIQGIDKGLAGAKFSILASLTLEDLKLGDSISVAGACLTASQVGDTGFSVDVSTETLNCTTLGTITVGTPVNLERAMKLNARMGGHLVTGHIDGIGLLRARQQDGNSIQLTIEAPEEMSKIEIYNAMGQQVKVVRDRYQSQSEIDINEIQPGIYYIQAYDLKGKLAGHAKFIKH